MNETCGTCGEPTTLTETTLTKRPGQPDYQGFTRVCTNPNCPESGAELAPIADGS